MSRRSRFMRNTLRPEGFPVLLRIISFKRNKTLSREQIRFQNLPALSTQKNGANLLRYLPDKFSDQHYL
jgi:hypothetical protein